MTLVAFLKYIKNYSTLKRKRPLPDAAVVNVERSVSVLRFKMTHRPWNI